MARMLLAFAARACYSLMVSSVSTTSLSPFSAELLPSWSASSLPWCIRFFFPRAGLYICLF